MWRQQPLVAWAVTWVIQGVAVGTVVVVLFVAWFDNYDDCFLTWSPDYVVGSEPPVATLGYIEPPASTLETPVTSF